jgi:WhiB family transcriptional regulator, redox-sensing transcriptional regulator
VRGTYCPRCGGVWTIILNPGTPHRRWHDDPLCARCRDQLEVEVVAELAELAAAAAHAAAGARDALEAELTAALAEQEPPGPAPAAEPGVRAGIGWSDEERRRHIAVALELSAPSVPQGDWVTDALCAQVDGDLFFPDKGVNSREAKKVCASCPVTVECLDWALTTNQTRGVFGGLSPVERRRLGEAAS